MTNDRSQKSGINFEKRGVDSWLPIGILPRERFRSSAPFIQFTCDRQMTILAWSTACNSFFFVAGDIMVAGFD